MIDRPGIQFFQSEPPSPRLPPTHFHVYEENDSGRAAVYIDGKAYAAGEWFEVVSEILRWLRVPVLEVDGKDLWLRWDAGDYEVLLDESQIVPGKGGAVMALRHELSELEETIVRIVDLRQEEVTELERVVARIVEVQHQLAAWEEK